MQKWIAAAALAAVLALPGAQSAYVSTGDVTGLATGLAPAPLGLPILYLNHDASVWQESNGFDGLQTEPIVDELGQVMAPPDTNVAPGFGGVPALPDPPAPEVPGVPADPGLPEVPALPPL